MNTRNTIRILLTAGAAIGSLAAHAQSGGAYDLKWNTIDGGGGASTAGVYSVTGTIGQPDAGKLSGGNYTLQGGFWGLFDVGQTPVAPLLRIVQTAGSQATLLWPTPSTGWVLQETPSMPAPDSAWTDVITPAVVVGPDNAVTVPATARNRFFRLRHP